jgi:DNA mismatch repair protein MutS2
MGAARDANCPERLPGLTELRLSDKPGAIRATNSPALADSLHERSRAVLDWPDLLARLAAVAHSDRGRQACGSLSLAQTVDQARAGMAEVAELAAALRAGDNPPGLEFPEVEPSLIAAEHGITLSPDEMRSIAALCDVAGAARRHFVGEGRLGIAGTPAPATPLLSALAADLEPHSELATRIRETFDPSGEIRNAASPELARLRRERDSLSSRVRSTIEELMRADDYADILQDRFWTVRGDRYVLPLRASAKSLNLGIVHDTSNTGETIFVEPTAMVALNNRLKLAELDIAREVRRILEDLSRDVASAGPALRAALERLARLDVVAAKARLAFAYDGHPVEIADAATIELRGARHPVLTLRAAREGFSVVANDIALDGHPARVLIVSGPNAGGKTVLLKTVGLAALLARAGMLVPAEPGGRVGFFHSVLADIGDQQSVLGDLSTFSAHLENIAEILRDRDYGEASGSPHADERRVDQRDASLAARRGLVLLDELMAGTNPDQGAALARAVAETLAGGDGLAVITTHYDGLKALADEDRHFRNAGMEYDPERLTPTFRLRDGVPGRSYALDIATRLGLPAPLLDRARRLAGGGSVGLEGVIATLESREATLRRETESLTETRDALAAREEAQRGAQEALERRERQLARHSREAIDESVREAREAIRAIVRQAQQAGTARAAEEAREVLATTARDALAAFPVASPDAAAPAALQPGTRVRVPSMAAEGRIVTAPDSRGRVKVALGSIVVEVDALELTGAAGVPLPPARPRMMPKTAASVARPVPTPTRTSGDDGTLGHARQSAQNTLDLRGVRADEVIDAVEAYLDRASRDERSPLFLIHGHGTGALKKIVRDYVTRSAYVRRWSPGAKGQGGDGVTIIEL